MDKKKVILKVNIAPIIATYALAAVLNRVPQTLEKRGNVDPMENIEQIEQLEAFFDKYNSPLKEHSSTFVETANRYNMDYKLLPAIACMESSCGKNLIAGSYNPFGWGIYGNNAIYFKDYDDAIATVGKGISEGYIEKGYDTPEEIAPIYTPPNHVHWLSGVRFFINEIETIQHSS